MKKDCYTIEAVVKKTFKLAFDDLVTQEEAMEAFNIGIEETDISFDIIDESEVEEVVEILDIR